MKKLFTLAISAATLLSACQMTEETTPSGSNVIKFTANMGSYSVKATDTSFEEGDAVTIAALDPINSGNVKYTVKDGILTSDTPICWNEGQTEETLFLFLYPYNPEIENPTVDGIYEFTINPDQSTHALYTASDLMCSYASASPADKQVGFKVKHVMSQIVINLDNRSDKTITDAYFSGVYGAVKFGYSFGFEATGSKGIVKACPISTKASGSWALIIAPQVSQPELIFTTSEGTQINYSLPEEVSFELGCRYTANVVLDENSTIVDFSAEILDWTPDAELNFKNEGQDEQLEYLGTGKILDDIIAPLFGITHTEAEAEYYADKDGNIIILDPYKKWWENSRYKNAFDFIEGRRITLVNNGDGSYYIAEGSSTGLSMEGYGEFKVMSTCVENGFEGEYGYFYFMYNRNLTSSENTVVISVDGEYCHTNDYGMQTFTMPGDVRYPVHYNFMNMYYDLENFEICFTTPLDITRAGLVVIPDSQAMTYDLIMSIIDGSAENLLWYSGSLNGETPVVASCPLSSTGVYRIIAAGDCTYVDGEWYYGYTYKDMPFVAPGEEAPECNVYISDCKPVENNPSTVDVVVKGDHISNFNVTAVLSSEFERLSDEELIAKYSTTGTNVRNCAASCANGGTIAKVSGLNPGTEYVIVVVGTNGFGKQAVFTTKITTAKELSFTSIGTGKFYDLFTTYCLADDSVIYETEVEILQESSGKPVYRVMNPYAKLQRERPELYGNEYKYSGVTSEYIEFSTHQYSSGNYVFYNPFHNGISEIIDGVDYKFSIEHGSGDVYANPENYIATYCNLETAPGVFSFAPAIFIGDSGYYYNFQSNLHTMTVVLPGYEWDPDAGQTKSGIEASRSHSSHGAPQKYPADFIGERVRR